MIQVQVEKRKGIFSKILKKKNEEECDLLTEDGNGATSQPADTSTDKEGGDLELSLEEDEEKPEERGAS